jgi:hypothetical protein
VWKVLRRTGKPECILAVVLRARARRWRSLGQRGRVGFDSARNSQMARESVIVVEGREWHWRIGTRPVGEQAFICCLFVFFVSECIILGWGCVEDVGMYFGELYELACMGDLEVF